MKVVLMYLALMVSSMQLFAQRSAQDNLTEYFGQDQEEASVNGLKVDPYTGTAKIGYTLFSYSNSTSKLSHAISVIYDASGVKVDNAASELGLNWSLNIGGSITREVRGIVDENGGNIGWANSQATRTNFTSADSSILRDHVNAAMDGEFDIYHWVAGNESGDFIIGKSGTILTIPEGNAKIERFLNSPDPNYTSLNICTTTYTFKITLNNGSKYYFDIHNCLEINYKNRTDFASTKWYLTKVESAFDQDNIILEYEHEPSSLETFNIINYRRDPPVPTNNPPYTNDVCQSVLNKSAENFIYYIARVIYGDGTVAHFNYYQQNPRKDGENVRTLKGLNIANSYGASYDFNFEHGHFQRGSGSQGIVPLNYPVGVNNSLVLTGIYKTSNGHSLPGYRFEYDATSLPTKFGDGVDLWGYANGEQSQYGRIIELKDENGNIIHPGSSRTPNLNYAKAGSITEIWTPNGGRIQIEYELHTTNTTSSSPLSYYQHIGNAAVIGGLRVKKITSVDHTMVDHFHNITNLREMVKEYKYVDIDEQTSSGVLYNYPVNNYVYKETYPYYTIAGYYGNGNRYSLLSCVPSFQNGYNARDYMVRTANQLNYPFLTRGQNVGYKRVVEYNGTSASFKEKKVYEFSTLGDYYTVSPSLINPHFPFPYIANIDFIWGLAKSVTLYNANDQILSQKIFDWDVQINNYNSTDFLAVRVGVKKYPLPPRSTQPNFPIEDYFDWSSFYPLSGKARLTKTEQKSYFEINAQGQPLYQSKTTENYYDNIYNVPMDIVVKKYKYNADLNIKFYYPFQFNANTNIHIALLNNVGLNYSPLRVEKWLNYSNGTKQLLDVVVKDIQMQNRIVCNNLINKFAPSSPVTSSQWGSFNPNNLFQNSQYFINQGSFERFDQFGNVNQININSIRTSTLWGYNKRLPVAIIKNALLDDIAYTSFENGEMHGWVKTGTTQIVAGITGKSAGRLNQSIYSKEGLNRGKRYVITMYVKGTPPLIAGTNSITNITASVPLHSVELHQGWTLYKGEFTDIDKIVVFAVGSLPGGGFTTVDELRLHPEDAQMETATYIPLYGKTSVCDMSNKIESYEYDDFGRLIGVKDVDGNINIAKEYNQNYRSW